MFTELTSSIDITSILLINKADRIADALLRFSLEESDLTLLHYVLICGMPVLFSIISILKMYFERKCLNPESGQRYLMAGRILIKL